MTATRDLKSSKIRVRRTSSLSSWTISSSIDMIAFITSKSSLVSDRTIIMRSTVFAQLETQLDSKFQCCSYVLFFFVSEDSE